MSIMHFRSIERRRTARVTLCMNLLVYGEFPDGEKFKFWSRTTCVSGHGGVLGLDAPLQPGQIFEIMNEFNMRKASAKVVSLRRGREGQVSAAFEFLRGGERFWSMSFPAAGARPLRRFRSKADGAGH
jgi:hypothetical protein